MSAKTIDASVGLAKIAASVLRCPAFTAMMIAECAIKARVTLMRSYL